MAYRNILWIKLEKRLLNDYRFYTMSANSQLFYVKLLLLSAHTTNKIPKSTLILASLTRSALPLVEIDRCIKEIKLNFPKFRESANYYYFRGWNTKHNWIEKATPKQLPSNSQGIAQQSQEKIRKDKIRKEKKGKPFFNNLPLIKKKDGTWWVIHEPGDWRRFVGSLKEIEWK